MGSLVLSNMATFSGNGILVVFMLDQAAFIRLTDRYGPPGGGGGGGWVYPTVHNYL